LLISKVDFLFFWKEYLYLSMASSHQDETGENQGIADISGRLIPNDQGNGG
jgi:hypothetical protein